MQHSAWHQKAVGEMINSASDKIAQKVVAGLEARAASNMYSLGILHDMLS